MAVLIRCLIVRRLLARSFVESMSLPLGGIFKPICGRRLRLERILKTQPIENIHVPCLFAKMRLQSTFGRFGVARQEPHNLLFLL